MSISVAKMARREGGSGQTQSVSAPYRWPMKRVNWGILGAADIAVGRTIPAMLAAARSGAKVELS